MMQVTRHKKYVLRPPANGPVTGTTTRPPMAILLTERCINKDLRSNKNLNSISFTETHKSYNIFKLEVFYLCCQFSIIFSYFKMSSSKSSRFYNTPLQVIEALLCERYICFFFTSFMLYPACSRVVRGSSVKRLRSPFSTELWSHLSSY